MQVRHDDLCRRDAFFFVNRHRNTAAVIADRDRPIAIHRHLDTVTDAGQGFVDRIIDDFINHMVQSRSVIGISDIHAGSLADGVQTTQNLDGIGAVFLGRRNCRRCIGRWCHGFITGLSYTSGSRNYPGIGDRKMLCRRTQRGKQGRIGSGHPCLSAHCQNFIEQRLAARLVEMRRYLIEQKNRYSAGIEGLKPCIGQHDTDQQCFLFARRTKRRRHILFEMDDFKIAYMGPRCDAARMGSMIAGPHQGSAEMILGIERGHLREPVIEFARNFYAGGWKRANTHGAGRIEPADQIGARGGDGDALFHHGGLDRIKPGAVGRPAGGGGIAENPGSVAHRLFISLQAARMGRIEGKDQTVEKPAAARRAINEQTLHIRRQPQGGDNFAQRRLAAHRRAIDAHDTARTRRLRIGRIRRKPGSDIAWFAAVFDTGRHRPGTQALLIRYPLGR